MEIKEGLCGINVLRSFVITVNKILGFDWLFFKQTNSIWVLGRFY